MLRSPLSLSTAAVLTLLAPWQATALRAADSGPPFTSDQAAAGETLYGEQCASCHGGSLKGSHLAPALLGPRFDQTFRGRKAALLAYHVGRMPPESSAVAGEDGELAPVMQLDGAQRSQVVAYLLRVNGMEAGEETLPTANAALDRLQIPQLPGADVEIDAPPAELSRRQRLRLSKMEPVTAEELAAPPAEDWLHWGRTYDGRNTSPLDQINRETVAGLETAWRRRLRPGVSMSMPLVHDGVMFLHSYPDTVLALDATTGDVLWRHQHESKLGSSQKMGLAVAGDLVIAPTSDLQVIALQQQTGEEVWRHQIVPETESRGPGGHQLRSAPMVAGNRVIQGVTASFASRGGFLLGLDLETGEEVWRFNTIPRPGEPGYETWNDVPIDKRSGGSVWHQGTYDPESGLAYYGVAPTYDTGPLVQPVEKEGISSEALYTNCTIALNAETGELVWWYQHMANDQWDLDWAFERQLVELPWKGEDRKVVLNVGKMAIAEALDATTGEYLFSVDPGLQNVITAIDQETGAKTIDMEKWPDPSRSTLICPSASGARAWPPMSFSEETRYLYLPLVEWCMTLGPQGARLLTSGVGILPGEHPDAADGSMGRLQAIDLALQEPAWTHDQMAPLSTSSLATAGGVVFAGDLEPSLKAFDVRSGDLLWRGQLDDAPSSTVITYAVDERQYVAVLVGINNLHVGAMARTWSMVRQRPNVQAELPAVPPAGGAAVWVFALPR